MSEFDRDRIALVVAEPARGGAAGESVGTGYFLTGDLVLTARHVGERNWKFRIRAENGGSEEDRWSPAEPCWVGAGDVDAMLLRTQRRFGDWEVPDFPDVTDGAWRSAGYAKAAADEEHDNRKTLPLYGSFDVSLGQGPAELALQTEQIISEGSDSSWKGVSGAPVFATGSAGHDGLIGIITDATRVMRNSLTGLSVSRILSDINFRSVIAPSFLSWLPAMPWGLCLVLTSEGWKSDLTGKVADVLSGYRDEPQFMRLYGEPIEIPVLGAVESAENWMATVNALAQADYLIADVTSFEPAVMLLLGIRSVLRRGVTISVSADMPTVLASSVPFNVRETRVLPLSAPRFYERLHRKYSEVA